MAWFERLRSGLERTRSKLLGGLEGLLRGRKAIDRELLEEIAGTSAWPRRRR